MSAPKSYRKKPVVIEVMGPLSTDNIGDTAYWCRAAFSRSLCEVSIETPEGTMTASEGDYVIRGVQGEFYPCKPDIFAATYDEVPA